MHFKVKKVISILCAASCLASLSGCFLLPVSKNYTYAQVSEELRKEITVNDWDGQVPEGMEVRYVLTRELSKDSSGMVIDHRYDYDNEGRRIAETDVKKNYSIRMSYAYNDDGTLARKEHRTTGKITGYHINDYKVDFEYNDKGQITSYTRIWYADDTLDETSRDVNVYEYENGHLVRAGDSTYDYNDDAAPYYEYIAVVNEPDSSADVTVRKCFYDEEGLLISEEYGERTRSYEYENGVLTGITVTDKWGYCSYCDAEGNMITETDKDGNLIQRDERNANGDRTCHEEWRNGKPRSKDTYTYVYDDKGNRLSVETEYWSVKDDGTESSFRSFHTYEYDEHGLLTAEVVEVSGKFSRMVVYSYEAILVPAQVI